MNSDEDGEVGRRGDGGPEEADPSEAAECKRSS